MPNGHRTEVVSQGYFEAIHVGGARVHASAHEFVVRPAINSYPVAIGSHGEPKTNGNPPGCSREPIRPSCSCRNMNQVTSQPQPPSCCPYLARPTQPGPQSGGSFLLMMTAARRQGFSLSATTRRRRAGIVAATVQEREMEIEFEAALQERRLKTAM